MKTTDVAFLCAVVLFAGVFVARSVSYDREEQAPQSESQRPVPTGANRGEARDVDLDKILRLIERGDLSNREAEYYAPAPALSKDNAMD